MFTLGWPPLRDSLVPVFTNAKTNCYCSLIASTRACDRRLRDNHYYTYTHAAAYAVVFVNDATAARVRALLSEVTAFARALGLPRMPTDCRL